MKLQNAIGLAALSGIVLFYSFTPDGKDKSQVKPIDLANMDKSVRPQDDFYEFANGGWLKNNPVPSTESKWGSFSALLEENQYRLRGILEENTKKANTPGSNGQKIGDYYFTYMDSVKKNKDGVKPLARFLQQVNEIKTNDQLMAWFATSQMKGVKGVWSIYVSADPKSSSVNIAQANQGGLGMPDRDYYLRNDPDSKSLQDKYKQLLVKDFELLGESKETATANAEKVYNLEVELAKASMTNVELRDLEKQYNKWSIAELDSKYPNIKFSTYLQAIGLGAAKEVIIGQPDFFQKASDLIKSQPLDVWKAYLRWNIITSFSDQLSDEVAQVNFDFYGTALSGQKKMKPRWKRAISEVDQMMGEALGQLFVAKYFPEESKKKVDEMVNNLIAAYRERINGLDWMSAETKEKAQKKLNTIIRKLGYPDTWRDYSKLTISRNSHFENYINSVEFEIRHNYEKLPKPVDKMEWLMSPPTVNAYYNPTSNEITFPAGIMQPPFYFAGADDAVNYAAIGAVIGHELTHGFDDQGSQFDEEGNMKDWWTASDKEKFLNKTQMVVAQFNGYVAIDSLHINGELTLGENIADLGGLSISYAAFQKTTQAKEGKLIDGFTPNQRFFLSWAQIWRTNFTPAAMKKQVNTNPHSPGKFRGNGPLTNLTEFYEAFGVKEGDKMWVAPEKRAKIW
ncbi:MAG: M13 family metallopeptidase [Bacteroidia bacterium]|nr:M13 family metallopeptidase [Bacteroidia bacterium]